MDTVACPHCSGEILDDPALAGQKVDCPHCGKKVKMLDRPAARPAGARAAPPKAAPPRPAAPRHSDSSADQPPFSFAATPPAPPPAPAGSADGGFAIDTSHASRSPSSPRSMPRRPPEGNPWLWPGLIGGGIAVIGLLLSLLANRSAPIDPNGPSGALERMNRLGVRGDWHSAYDCLTKATQKRFENEVRPYYAGEGEPTAAELRSAARDAFVKLMQTLVSRAGGKFSPTISVVSETRKGNRAAVTLREPNGKTTTHQLAYEDGAWKVELQ